MAGEVAGLQLRPYWNFIGTEISQPALVNWPTFLTTVPFTLTFLNKIGPTYFPEIFAGRLGVWNVQFSKTKFVKGASPPSM